MLKHLLIALSLANLCFLDVWRNLIVAHDPKLAYLRKDPADPTFLIATILNVILLALSTWLIVVFVLRTSNLFLLRIIRAAFLVVLVMPLNLVMWELLTVLPHGTPRILLGISVTLIKALLVAVALLQLARPIGRVVAMAQRGLLLVSPLCAITLLHLAWLMLSSGSTSTFFDKGLVEMLPNTESRGRVLVLLFDEMDQHLLFEKRPSGIDLPEIDKLRKGSLYATQAHSPASSTKEAIPSLITGRIVNEVATHGPDDLTLKFRNGEEKWRDVRTVFSVARSSGFNCGIAGWYLPYCRVLENSLSYCIWTQTVQGTDAFRQLEHMRTLGLVGSMDALIRRQLHWVSFASYFGVIRPEIDLSDEIALVRSTELKNYLSIRKAAISLAGDPRLNLVFIHWPIPHPFGIYDRDKNDYTLDPKSNYIDNLELVDRTLGEIRKTMVAADLWEKTSVLVMADHSYRRKLWRCWPMKTAETAIAIEDGDYPQVPFLLKVAGQSEPLTYETPFNTIAVHDLLLELLRRNLSPHEVIAFLNRDWGTSE